MLAYISGRILHVFEGQVLLKIPSGLGYLVNVSNQKSYMINENIDLYIWEVWREDRPELFGFDNLEDRVWLEKLLKVSGVGPKSAATIIYTLGAKKIQESIASGDSEILSTVKGLGVKTAKKIVLELKGTATDLESLSGSNENSSQTAIDFTDTLTNLGYKRGEIVSAISQLKKTGEWQEGNLVSLVKKSLLILGKK